MKIFVFKLFLTVGLHIYIICTILISKVSSEKDEQMKCINQIKAKILNKIYDLKQIIK